MQRTIILAATLATLLLAAAALPAAAASETGFHTMHALKRVGGKLCMASHTHAGQSLPSARKSVALRLAIDNWASFTAMEYGTRWGSWSLAWAKAEKCTGGDGNWVCEVTARPCQGK